MSRNIIAGPSLWFAHSDSPSQKAERLCRHFSCPFQVQCCRMMIYKWFTVVHIIMETRFGVLGAKTPSRQLFSVPYFLVSLDVFFIISDPICLWLYVNMRYVSIIPFLWTWRKHSTENVFRENTRSRDSFVSCITNLISGGDLPALMFKRGPAVGCASYTSCLLLFHIYVVMSGSSDFLYCQRD